jgi:hypothetical protein
MASAEIPNALRRAVRARALGCCEYCKTAERVSGLACQVDHIIPVAKGGQTLFENLCLACSACNGYKGAATAAFDQESSIWVPLFHPREQVWSDHFAWNTDDTLIVGLTPTGCSTVVALRMNNLLIVSARRLWTSVGWHPPQT